MVPHPTFSFIPPPPPWPTVSCFPAVNDLVCYLDPIAVTGSLNESLQLLVNPRRIVEDILVFSKTWDEHVEAVRRLFARVAEHDVSLNTRKVQFAQQTVTFGGYVVSENHSKPDPEYTRTPTD